MAHTLNVTSSKLYCSLLSIIHLCLCFGPFQGDLHALLGFPILKGILNFAYVCLNLMINTIQGKILHPKHYGQAYTHIQSPE